VEPFSLSISAATGVLRGAEESMVVVWEVPNRDYVEWLTMAGSPEGTAVVALAVPLTISLPLPDTSVRHVTTAPTNQHGNRYDGGLAMVGPIPNATATAVPAVEPSTMPSSSVARPSPLPVPEMSVGHVVPPPATRSSVQDNNVQQELLSVQEDEVPAPRPPPNEEEVVLAGGDVKDNGDIEDDGGEKGKQAVEEEVEDDETEGFPDAAFPTPAPALRKSKRHVKAAEVDSDKVDEEPAEPPKKKAKFSGKTPAISAPKKATTMRRKGIQVAKMTPSVPIKRTHKK
jgi:hypothetical protein